MQQSEGRVEWAFSLFEEEQFSIHCQDLNVFMAAEEKYKSQVWKNSQKMLHMKKKQLVIPSHYFDGVLFWHDVI